MTVQQSSTKAAATLTEVAALCQLSRSRFHDLVKAGVFPKPVHNAATKRPIYTRDLIDKCLQIRETGIGLDGRIIVFNRRRASPAPRRVQRPPVATAPKESAYTPLVTGLRSLGMLDVAESQVEKIVTALFPGGIAGRDLGDVIRAVFLELKKQQ
jgi:hypothetical protein